MFEETCQRLACPAEDIVPLANAVRRLQGVTPGDFAVLTKQAAVGGEVSATGLLRQLEQELAAKPGSRRTMGF